MQRSSLLGGALYGLLMGGFAAFNALTEGATAAEVVLAGLAWAIPGAILFGGALHLFGRSRWLQRSIALEPDELVAGERLLFSTTANMIVRPKDFGLQAFAFDQLLWLAGMRDREAIGGGLHLTNLRLVFRSHRINRLRGTVSIFLPTVRRVEDASSWLLRRFHVHTGAARLEFISDDVRELVARIEPARDAISPADQQALEALGSRVASIAGLQPDIALTRINSVLSRGMQVHAVVDAALKPMAALASILAGELFDRSVAERWQRRLEPPSAEAFASTDKPSPDLQEIGRGHSHRPPGK